VRERERKREKERERQQERKTERETKNRRGVDIVATNVTAITVPTPPMTSSRPAFEEKRGKEEGRQQTRQKEKKKERERQKSGVQSLYSVP